jgi:lipopolysaccharide biosynthesis regulator YciM
LALDFLKAGLLDRAESALRRLEGTSFEEESRLALLSIYERSRDWANATDIAGRLGHSSQGSFSARQSHYLCEQASASAAGGDTVEAGAALLKAVAIAPDAGRPLIDLAKWQNQSGDTAAAFQTLMTLEKKSPQNLPLAASLLANIASGLGQQAETLTLLQAAYARTPSIDLLEAIIRLDTRPDAARHWYAQHLAQHTSLVAATRWMADQSPRDADNQAPIQRALDQATKPLMRYRCAACGFETTQHFWHCPGCQAWDSYPARRVEEL